MDSYNLEEAKTNLTRILEKVSADQKLCRITSDHGNAVLLSEETYDNLLITLELLSTPGLIDGLKELEPNPSN
jgi:antitoxin YefM